MESRFLPEADWHDLLREIHNHQVIPIVGPEVVTVREPCTGISIPLYRALAPKLAAALGVPTNGAPATSLNRVACDHLLSGGVRKAIYLEVAELLDRMELTPPQALCDLASITDFDLFISGTIDPLLAVALERARPGFQRPEHVLAYASKRPVDVAEKLEPALVYHILGNRQTYPDFAVWEAAGHAIYRLARALFSLRSEGRPLQRSSQRTALSAGRSYRKLKNFEPKFFARACENAKINVPDRKEDQATEVSEVIQTLMEILTDEDLRSVAEVYRGALHANQRHWVDEGKDPKTGRARGHWEVIPDFKTRIAAANMIAAYKEGLPVQRQVVLTKAFESAEDTIKKIKGSPELLKAIQALQGSGLALEAGGEIIDIAVQPEENS